MASFRQLRSGNWQATIHVGRRDGRRKRQYKTFAKLSEARRWAEQQEAIVRRWVVTR